MSDTQFDITALSARHVSEEARVQRGRRRAAEWRLRLYGIIAIAIAVAALLVLIVTVVSKTASVAFEYYVTVETEIELSDRQQARIDDPNPRLLPSLDKVVRKGVTAATGQKISRKQRKDLKGLLSGDAGYELGKMVKADPTLVGQTITYSALLDDQIQLYLQGYFGTLQDAASAGNITVSPTDDDGEVDIIFQTGALADAIALMQQDRAREAQVQARIAADQARAVRETAAKLTNAASDDERATLTGALEGFEAALAKTTAKQQAAETAATDPAHVFTMRPDDPSVFIQALGGWLRLTELGPKGARGQIMDPLAQTGPVTEGAWSSHVFERPEGERKVNDRQIIWLHSFAEAGLIEERFNWRVLSATDSSNAELAGIWGALVGSFWTMIVTIILAFPIGVMAAVYLEEFAPKNRLTAMIEVNINNLAAVPSIVFGLFGITVLISGVKLFGVDLFDGLLKAITDDPRSTPLVGGVVLALMSLPTIIIASRAMIKTVPPSIRDGALALGASRLQTSMHHVLPLAMPGILTGAIIALARALGETAPLIIVGMNAFIQDPPTGPLDNSTVLPSLIYLWNNQAERLFDGKTAVAISVLLIFLVLMNGLAVMLRKRFERRW